ncbi:hypothetical protein [Flavobacterium sp. NKUCC04_CG]|uniref:hypothetical protein n=1 Tax=Flavobacterium sp. NKUCC04_CG TaxID=2842121 RepID=UPI001C5BAC8A|nr:hypothetical protein [Flavobacterium sp. NKUCC04_CG]MBW3519491.1 hypothetical protein [Flavobacterium sp. NKUCC04_CG]
MRAFRDNLVFSNYQVNSICDEIYNLVKGIEVPEPMLLLTGLAAYFLQRGTDHRPLNNVIFTTSNIDVYNELILNINQLGVLNILKYDNRILFEGKAQFQTVYFEIWLDPVATESVDINGVFCQRYNLIKTELL